ncbi:hypothetical protein [Acinetobacter larvae]|uniref:Antitermination protein n=1 Tax=Acinetobacter larvae TaxID=1789224 RepID=A0A1B2M439_9GAMM|nr:hypothetical protein [Acinetobacter larvae]AOA59922.1 hypothetical protein BFG52_07455 [Acinetobacter larvae]
MNAAVTIMQAVDWSKYDLQDWLKQFGLWQNSVFVSGGGENPIYQAMRKAKLKLSEKDRCKIIAYYLCDENFNDNVRGSRAVCLITDDEARAVQRLVLDIVDYTESEVMLEWMDAIICRYFKLRSWSEMKTNHRTVMDAKYDIRCGLAVLHNRNPQIRFTRGKI